MLCDAFAEHLARAGDRKLSSPRLETELQRALAHARARHPGVALDEGTFAAFLASKIAPDDDPFARLAALHTDALYLARAAVAGDAAAVAAIAAMIDALGPRLARFRRGSEFVDEIEQSLRERLLTGASPRLLEYGGRGELVPWLRAVALRLAIDRMRAADRRERDEDTLTEHAVASADPELELMKQRYGAAFAGALRGAIVALEPGARNLLRLYHLDGLTLEELGRLQRVVPSTIWRRLAGARKQLLERTRATMREALALGDRELESVLRLVESRFELPASAFEGTEDA
jgi:RNA polymerase sigma-70 factor (ECF subfamily)